MFNYTMHLYFVNTFFTIFGVFLYIFLRASSNIALLGAMIRQVAQKSADNIVHFS